MPNFVQLHSRVTSLVVRLTPSPEILYWGKSIMPLDEAAFDAMAATMDRGIGQARLDHDIPISLCPELGRGYFGRSGIEGHRVGQDWAPIFTVSGTENLQSSIELKNEVKISCRDEHAQLEIIILLSLHPTTGVLSHSITVTNLAEQAYQLNQLSITMPLPHRAQECMALHGRWSREFQPQRHTISHGGFHQENRRGRTSHEYFPGCLMGTPNFTDQLGEVWSFHLGWSGNHHWRADVKSDGRRLVQFGELLAAGEIALGQNQSYTTPILYCAYSESGMNGIRAVNHQFVRDEVLLFDSSKVRPVHLNTWEGIYFDHDPAYICEMATQAAAIGVERFIIDDGWFKGRNDDTSALGDWVLDTKKYPNGLTPVIDHVINLDMEFGIWVEPEMVNQESDLYRAHPEWLLATANYPVTTGRNQLVLNLQNPQCFDYLYEHLDNLLSNHQIRYVKWDMNREIVQASHLGRAAIHGQTKAMYRLFQKITTAHPLVEFESCSSGGARIDYQILHHTYRFWTSDCNDALERQTMQRYLSLFMPPEVMGAHIGPKQSHTTRRTHDIHWRGLTALTGHMGVELDPVKESEHEKQQFSHYIQLHKRFRHLLHTGETFYLDNNDQRRNVYGVHNPHEAVVLVAQLAMPDYALPEYILFDWLDSKANYRIELVDFPETSSALMKKQPQWLKENELVVSGDVLKRNGLSLPVLDPEAAMMLHLTRI
ncbi:alpha-galactosidase [Vibrio tapetis subsp. quintayensis]|uniref:alpha-galactosidase n=1 Tax=Vibrio tapetis TaxID=52443 RepID=UPI0025B4ED6D|nr:alpha-galactosidase [Vibrio tapetis]MDN3681772.1 alpha-galactosidase [Vibrio tapetis subsp. quintayensis]